MMKSKEYSALIIILAVLIISSCRKREFDEPPIKEIPVGNILTIQELRDLFQGESIRFEDDFSVFATITMDDRNGNIFRNAYAEDETNAILLRTRFPGGLFVGDSVRIALKGTTLTSFNGLLQLDSVDVDRNIIKQATQRTFAPTVVTIADLINSDFQSRLVRLENVEFVSNDLSGTYANAATQQSLNRTLTDCNGNEIIVRTSGFADFAGQTVAQGNGSMVAIANEFNGVKQLLIRSIEEVKMNGQRCGGDPTSFYLSKDFNDQSISSGGWQSYVVQSTPGNHTWTTSSQGSPGNYYAVATGWNGSSADDTEIWLISPLVDLSNATAPQLTFRSSTRFNGPALQLMVSTDYDGVSNPAQQGTWVNYTSFANWSPGDFLWTNSGIIPMIQFLTDNVTVAFKYQSGNGQSAATWQVDDIIIQEN
ncbi:MAG: choice-of-anchor J domain-containing protein [Crocinitomicaceae bacterium]|nr:choice-of-anchor J domain-containing protein [Crocinitomicaceae bacterium]